MLNIIKIQSKLLSKEKLTDETYEFKYEVPQGFPFEPGQFVGLQVPPYPLRSYSIVDIKNGAITLLIDIFTKSNYFVTTQVGDVLTLSGAYGVFKVKDTDLPKVFICTGTGVAPFIPMVKKLLASPPHAPPPTKFFFGSRYLKDDYTAKYFGETLNNPNLEFVRCVTRPEEPIGPDQQYTQGRVTEIVPKHNIDWKNSEFYICGSPQMVTDMKQILMNLGADKIYVEKF